MSKVLVTYFSASGVTKSRAEELCKAVSGELFEIAPTPAYTKEDLDYTNKESRVSVVMSDASTRPEIACDKDVAEYDTVFVGFPIWYGVAPHEVNTFLEKHDFAGKTVIPWATCGGSPFAKAYSDFALSVPGANLKEGGIVASDEDVAKIASLI